jgi:hypothetical protein
VLNTSHRVAGLSFVNNVLNHHNSRLGRRSCVIARHPVRHRAALRSVVPGRHPDQATTIVARVSRHSAGSASRATSPAPASGGVERPVDSAVGPGTLADLIAVAMAAAREVPVAAGFPPYPAAGGGAGDFRGTSINSRRGLARRRGRIQAVFQGPLSSLNPRMRVGAAIGEALKVNTNLSQRMLDERVATLMESVGFGSGFLATFLTSSEAGSVRELPWRKLYRWNPI